MDDTFSTGDSPPVDLRLAAPPTCAFPCAPADYGTAVDRMMKVMRIMHLDATSADLASRSSLLAAEMTRLDS